MSDRIQQGDHVGESNAGGEFSYSDPETGIEIRQLTDFRAHSQHFYFTDSGWYDNDRRLLFGSDVGGIPNYHSIDLETGVVTQVTDLPMLEQPYRGAGIAINSKFSFRNRGSINPKRAEAYFWHNGRLIALDLAQQTIRSLYELPDGFLGAHTDVTADGEFVCISIYEDTLTEAATLPVPSQPQENYWSRKPTSQVVEIPVDGGDAVTLHSCEDHWIKHVNTSPTNSELLTFCHQSTLGSIDNRIWGLDRAADEVWKIRPHESDEKITHEYWLQNGEDIGYHGSTRDGDPFWGVTRYDNSRQVEVTGMDSHHFHSNDRTVVVGDGDRTYPYLLLWKCENGEYLGPRKLAWHDSMEHPLDVHPRFSPSGAHVLFASDRTGYTNLYLATVPEFERLPQATEYR